MSITFPEKSLPTVAIVGRTNVGKSTLFNCLIEKKKALVSSIAGTTRTSNIDTFLWRGKKFRLIDTGGVDFDKTNLLEIEIKKQIKTAFQETNAILFLVDLQAGFLPQEKIWAKELRHLKVPLLLVGNKADSQRFRQNVYNPEWLKLGLGVPLPISAVNGTGVGDLLDKVIEKIDLPNHKISQENSFNDLSPIYVSILGRPNVGKSTLFNALIGEERVIISPIAHTTRESHDTLIIKDKEPYLFVDTVGLRKRSRQDRGLEREGVAQAENSLGNSNLALLVLDANEPFTAQDKDIINMISEKSRKGLIIVVNKWDLIDDKYVELQNEVKERLYRYFPPLCFAPIIFVSGKTHQNVEKIFPLIKQVAANCKKKIDNRTLDDFLKKLIRYKTPLTGKGVRHPKIYALRQVDVEPPTFEVTIKQKTSLHDSYLRFMENKLREYFDLLGTPVVVYVRKIKV